MQVLVRYFASNDENGSTYVPVISKAALLPPPAQTPWHLTFTKSFGQVPRYFASLEGQMPTR